MNDIGKPGGDAIRDQLIKRRLAKSSSGSITIVTENVENVKRKKKPRERTGPAIKEETLWGISLGRHWVEYMADGI